MKITVITVCLNSEKTIERTINSILNQKYKNIEFIVIDGKSTDDTINIVNKYKSKIHKIISEKDDGIYDAINKGIKICSGDVISILHSDDSFINEDVLSNVVKHFANEKKIECLIGNTIITKNNKILRKYSSKIFKPWMIYFGFSPPHPSSFFKKKIYEKYGLFKTKYNIAGDFEFFLRTLLLRKVLFKTVSENYVNMLSGGKSTYSVKSNLVSSIELLNAFKENNIYNNYFFISLRFPIKLMQYIFR